MKVVGIDEIFVRTHLKKPDTEAPVGNSMLHPPRADTEASISCRSFVSLLQIES
jgi:hypothetical protein